MRYILFLALLIFTSCGKKKGCMNEWGSNYNHDAIVDCCCEFDLDAILADVVGSYNMQEQCSGESMTYEVNITLDPNDPEGIIISNFNNSSASIKASWNVDEFALQTNWVRTNCVVTTTGSVHKASGKIYFIYAAFPENTCDDTKGLTCEARSII